MVEKDMAVKEEEKEFGSPMWKVMRFSYTLIWVLSGICMALAIFERLFEQEKLPFHLSYLVVAALILVVVGIVGSLLTKHVFSTYEKINRDMDAGLDGVNDCDIAEQVRKEIRRRLVRERLGAKGYAVCLVPYAFVLGTCIIPVLIVELILGASFSVTFYILKKKALAAEKETIMSWSEDRRLQYVRIKSSLEDTLKL